MEYWKKFQQQERGFTLLEMVVAVAVIGILSTALSGTIISQYQVWQYNINKAQVFEHSELFTSYFENDLKDAIDYNLVSSTELELELDKDKDGTFDESTEDELVRYSQNNLEQYSHLITEIEFEEVRDRLIKVDIMVQSGDFDRQLTKYFYIARAN